MTFKLVYAVISGQAAKLLSAILYAMYVYFTDLLSIERELGYMLRMVISMFHTPSWDKGSRCHL
jgi:hypothetical protein